MLPVGVPLAKALVASSLMPFAVSTFRPKVPSPLIVPTVTSTEVPEAALTLVMVAPETPAPIAAEKSFVARLFTFSENVTVKITEAALVEAVAGVLRTTEVTVGIVWSMV